MKNMKLAVKLAIGFGSLVAVALLFGGAAVWEMAAVGRGVDRLALEEAPMATASMEARVALSMVYREVIRYVYMGDESYRQKAEPHLAETRTRLQEALIFAEEHPGVARMKTNIVKASDSTREMEGLINETAERQKSIRDICARQDESAELFMGSCALLLKSQDRRMDELALEAAGGTNLTEKTSEMRELIARDKLVAGIIEKGIGVRVANWKSQALRDPAASSAALGDFDAIEKAIADLTPMMRSANDREQLAKVLQAARSYRQSMADLAGALAEREKTVGRLLSASVSAVDAVTVNVSRALEHVASTAARSSTDLMRAAVVMVGGLALATLLGVFLALRLTRSITRPILKGVAFANEMATGNFSHRLDIDRGDEIGLLACALNTVVENLQTQVHDIREAANVLVSSASEISASVTQVTSGARETATAVTQTTATVEEVKQSALLTSQKAKGVSDNAQRGLQTVLVGRKATELVVEGMTRITAQMASIADTIEKLGEQSQTIGEITATVDDISEQSNLLAVNAAVEAAKAGEHGKGFAVVAQEIKSLAEQSKQATKQVRSILGEIQKATAAAVMATELGGRAVDQGTKESMNANESIQALSSGFTESAQAAGQIAASTQEQLMGMDQVALAMGSIHEASQQNVTSMKQLEAAAQTLKEIGHRFAELVGRYKV